MPSGWINHSLQDVYTNRLLTLDLYKMWTGSYVHSKLYIELSILEHYERLAVPAQKGNHTITL